MNPEYSTPRDFWAQPKFGMFGANWGKVSDVLVQLSLDERGGKIGWNGCKFQSPLLYVAVRDLNPVAFLEETPFMDYMRQVAAEKGSQGVKILSARDTGKIAGELSDIPGVEARVMSSAKKNKGMIDYLEEEEFVLSHNTYGYYLRRMDSTTVPRLAMDGFQDDRLIYDQIHQTHRAIFERAWDGKPITARFIDRNTYGRTLRPPKSWKRQFQKD
jgi:hypothetical protein